MKNSVRYSIITGILIFVMLGFAPLSPTENQTNSPITIQYFVQSPRSTDYLPVASTLTPLSDINDKSYFTDEQLAVVDYGDIERNSFIEFDMKTHSQTVINTVDEVTVDPTLLQPKKGISPIYNGHFGELLRAVAEMNEGSQSDLLKPSTIFGDDDRELVENTTAFPFRSVVKIYVDTPNGPRYMGSGAVIDDTHVFTVGHIAYIHEDGGLVTSMEIIPGKKYSYEPYGSAWAQQIRIPIEWIIEASSQYDWALITLDRPIGASTGYMGLATYFYTNPVYTSTLYTAGYPGDLDNGYAMYNTSDVGSFADEYNHHFFLDTMGGQSGSPVWTMNASGEYIISNIAYSSAASNFGTRVSETIYNQIATWIGYDTSAEEKPEFRAIFWDINLDAWSRVYKKQTILGILTDIENLGRAPVNTLSVDFYLTKDKTINISEDYYLGTTTVNNLNVLESKSVDWYGRVSKDVPVGYYYMGWNIDPENSIDEYDETDNTGLVGTVQIIVSSTNWQKFIWSPLGTGLIIGASVAIVAGPTLGIIFGVRKRKKMRNLKQMTN